MLYRTNTKNGDDISQLGLGCMRFPRKGVKIDQEKTNELVAAAIESGVNYFDTGYIYPGSEEALGTALAASGRRDEIFIATKLPHFMCAKPEDFDRLFNTQLKRLQTDRIDYYLMHMLSNTGSWERLKRLGVEQWLDEKKAEGKIVNVGFSYHGGRADFLGLLDAYAWGFCMVQYNYFDENNQAGRHGVRAAHEKGMPVFVMEPLRGGLLVDGLTAEAKRAFGSVNAERSPAEWALRWLLDQREVTMALSGMSDLKQLSENSSVASDAEPGMLGDDERTAYKAVVEALNGTVRIPCTGCAYCMPCPMGVDIPACFSCYTGSYAFGLFSGLKQYVQLTGMTTPVQSDASKCAACGKCEEHCPQGIMISKELVKVKRRMISFLVRPVMFIARKFMRIK